ncbi:MAG: SIMPL domain-containing protein [Acidobacteriota bacterium]|nr:SIMPL domain-containing protein [Acidobacteriota bacterium]
MKSKFAVFFALIFLSLVSINGQTPAVNQPPTVDVSGTAEIQVVPDFVTFALRVTKSDKSLQVAKTQNDANMAQIIALTKRFAIDPTDVRTDFISVGEKFDRVKPKDDDEYQNVFAGYTVSKTVVIKLRDLSKFESFLSEIVRVGVTQIGSVSFESSEIRKHKDRARAMAIRAAREKAEAMAKELGQSIGKAVSIEEEDVDNNRSGNLNSNNTISFGLYNVSGSSETIAPGTISIRAEVGVRFLLY